jgi:hypothetical protein
VIPSPLTPKGDTATADEWAVRAENGATCRASEDVARRAVTEGAWTLNDSPVVAALRRPDANSEWIEYVPADNSDPGEDPRECSCAMTESSFRACPVHGENAPPY